MLAMKNVCFRSRHMTLKPEQNEKVARLGRISNYVRIARAKRSNPYHIEMTITYKIKGKIK